MFPMSKSTKNSSLYYALYIFLSQYTKSAQIKNRRYFKYQRPMIDELKINSLIFLIDTHRCTNRTENLINLHDKIISKLFDIITMFLFTPHEARFTEF